MRSNLHSIRQAAAALRSTLLSPPGAKSTDANWAEAIAAHVPALQDGAVILDRLRDQELDAQERRELYALSAQLRGLGKLVARGLGLTHGMVRLLAPASGSYRPDGEPVPPNSPGTIWVRG